MPVTFFSSSGVVPKMMYCAGIVSSERAGCQYPTLYVLGVRPLGGRERAQRDLERVLEGSGGSGLESTRCLLHGVPRERTGLHLSRMHVRSPKR